MAHANAEYDPTSHGEVIAEEQQRYHTFINIALFLAVLTGIEIVIIFFPWPYWLLMSGLVVLSLIKFVAVILWFMHLIYDRMLLFWLFMTGLLIGTGTLIALLALLDREDVHIDGWGNPWAYHRTVTEPLQTERS